MRASSTCMRMAFSGFFTSCATPPVMRLMAESRSAVWSCRPICRVASGSRRRTRIPAPAPLAAPVGSASSTSTESSATGTLRTAVTAAVDRYAPVADGRPGLRGLAAAAGQATWSAGKSRSVSCPSTQGDRGPEIFPRRRPPPPAAGRVRRPGRRPPGRPVRRSKLPRRSEKSYCAPRSCWPSRFTFDATIGEFVVGCLRGRAACWIVEFSVGQPNPACCRVFRSGGTRSRRRRRPPRWSRSKEGLRSSACD